uniref:Uncharacterized protein n=1 Tax=Lactuca sativa TaxID=4236 RepID=A0A9R1XP90_LACSA|nr:hypothetical protein LSAT_V11C300115380 [Lactuca sativa]
MSPPPTSSILRDECRHRSRTTHRSHTPTATVTPSVAEALFRSLLALLPFDQALQMNSAASVASVNAAVFASFLLILYSSVMDMENKLQPLRLQEKSAFLVNLQQEEINVQNTP